jgi:prepilin-type N-terminal cleavage/methylation domain-containing protein
MADGNALDRMSRANGFSLLEVLVAVLLVGGAIAGLGQLVTMAARANVAARSATIAAVLAAQKMEQLRADADRLTNGGSLQDDVAGYSDAFDGHGHRADGDGVSFIRRWAVSPLPFDPVNSWVLRVRVARVPGRNAAAPPWPGALPDEARLLTVVTSRDR